MFNLRFLFGDISLDMVIMLLIAKMAYQDVRKTRLEREILLRGLTDMLRKKFKPVQMFRL